MGDRQRKPLKKEIDVINEEYVELWKDHYGAKEAEGLRIPLQYPDDMIPKTLVFIGLNPSFSNEGWDMILQGDKDRLLNGVEAEAFFKWPISEKYCLENAKEAERLARQRYKKYFAPIWKISKNMGVEYENIDLFANRETSSRKTLKEVMERKKGKGEKKHLNEFGNSQLKVFKKLLNTLDPWAVIVNNAAASRIYIQQRKPKFDPSACVFRDSLDDGRKFPVFFTGMLTGGNLDIFSRDRLYWFLAKELKKTLPDTAWSVSSLD